MCTCLLFCNRPLVSRDLEIPDKHLFREDLIFIYFVWIQRVLASKKKLIYILNIFCHKKAQSIFSTYRLFLNNKTSFPALLFLLFFHFP